MFQIAQRAWSRNRFLPAEYVALIFNRQFSEMLKVADKVTPKAEIFDDRSACVYFTNT